jgi:phage baseplate assembly protein W
MALYKGYSTYNYEKNKSLGLTDVELVKQDILNHFYTRYGERLKMARFGCIVPDMVFEPMEAQNLAAIELDISKVMNYDPRIRVNSIVSSPDYDNSTLTVEVNITYIELDLNDLLHLNIEFEG